MEKKLLRQLIMLSKRIMYAFLIQLFMCTVLLANTGNAQRKTIEEVNVSLDLKEKTLLQFFRQVESKTDFKFTYNDDLVDLEQKVTVEERNRSLYRVLEAVSKQTDLHFVQVNENIHVKSAENKKEQAVEIAHMVDVTVSGTVTDSNGQPIPGATISIPGTTIGAATDLDGRYSLTVPEGSTLVFSFIGYETQSIAIGERSVIDVTLSEDMASLDEVVVVGYGVQKKANLTGAVSSVDAQTIEKRQVMNVGQALQGVVPGLNVVSNSLGGELNNTLNVDVRGMGTIGAGSSARPLILIDGAEGDMNAINPRDIENITILKDAAASSIYGSRAAFGVILITTKKGTVGKTIISYSSNVRFDGILNAPQTMGGEKYIQYINRTATNEGNAPAFSDLVIDRFNAYKAGEYVNSPDSYWNDPGQTNYGDWRDLIADTDWYNTYFKNWTPSQEHNLSVSGGSEKVTFRLSGGFLDQQGKVRYGKDNFDRYTLAAKVGANLAEWAQLNYSSSWIRTSYDRPSFMNSNNGRWFLHNTIRISPLSVVKNPDGRYSHGSEIIRLLEGGRALDERDVLTQQMQLVLEPVENWRITAEGNMITNTINNHQNILPVYRYNAFGEPRGIIWDYWNAVGIAQVREISTRRNYYSTNIFSDYSMDLSDGHHFTFLAGMNVEYEKYKGLTATRDGLLSIEVPTIGMTTLNPQILGDLTDWANTGVFGRINYNYKERYLFEANGRYDGSSRFIGDKRWGFFPSFSVGWNVANEEFFSPIRGKIDMLKVRGSWGSLGNMNTNNLYPFYLTMPIGISNGGWLVDGERPNVASAPGLVSSLLTWEKVSSFNIGFDWSAFENRFTGTLDYFQRYTNGMVGPAPELPSTLGTAVPSINNTDMKSMGFEVEFAWRDKIGEVGYNAKVLLSNDKQIVTNYPNEIMNFNNWYSGKLNGEIWGFTTKGIAQTDAEMDAHLASLPEGGQGYFGSNWAAGDIMYADLNGDGKVDQGAGTIADPGDMQIIGNNNPQFKTGFNLDVYWRNFDFSMFWAGVLKRDFLIGNAEANSHFWGANANVAETFALIEHFDFWRPEGDPLGANTDGYYPRPLYNYKNKHAQSRYLLNAAYIRLKNVQIGYTLPVTISEKIGSSSFRVFVSGENLITVTKLTKLFDPEVLGGRWGPGQTYPLGRTFAAGLSINF